MKSSLFRSLPAAAPRAVAREIPLLAATRYDSCSRLLAHRLKANDLTAIEDAALLMAPLIPQGSALVPMPSHSGCATYTRTLSNRLALLTHSEVADVLQGRLRMPHYAAKLQGKDLAAEDLAFCLRASLPVGRKVIVIDNVIDTGLTAVSAAEVLGDCAVLAYAMTGHLLL